MSRCTMPIISDALCSFARSNAAGRLRAAGTRGKGAPRSEPIMLDLTIRFALETDLAAALDLLREQLHLHSIDLSDATLRYAVQGILTTRSGEESSWSHAGSVSSG